MKPATSPDRWAKIKYLFAEAAELPTGAREAWLVEACGADATLRSEVEKLLAADAHASAFLETAPITQLAQEQFIEGERIGAYRIIRELGRGGMGTVYLAERAAVGFEQRVAIKVIKRGMDSDEVLRRFYAERQILAQLNHPNIARLLDGGQTADGRPYYVMEYIAGVALDEFCKSHSLPMAERLRLFQDVCAAMHYAHQQLVIHRDLKPSNILVTPEGQVKLLDFGIAKVLSPNLGETEATAETVTQHIMLTPAYASPEQMRGARLTTASDIYALGVILYELLTGLSPYNINPNETQAFTKAVCETEPLRPSVRALHTGKAQNIDVELDYIVLMALRKEATRRYGSVEQFSEDIRRYLNGLPVSARPDTWRYRLGKFVQRNRALTAAGLAVALSLTGGLALTWRQARIAERERALAQRRFEDVRQLANAFVFKYHDEVAKLQGSTALREMMVSDAKNYLTRLAQDTGDDVTDAALQLELAQAWMKIGDVLGKPYLSNLGQTDEAIKSYREARVLAEAVTVREPNNQAAKRILGLALQNLGLTETRAGKFSSALPTLQEAVRLLQVTVHEKSDADMRQALAQAYLALGDCVVRNGSAPEARAQALETYQQALRINEALAQEAPHDLRRQRAVAIIEQRLGTTLPNLTLAGVTTKDLLKRALAHHEHAAELLALVAAADPHDVVAQRDLFDQYQMKAEVQAKTGDVTGALNECRKTIAFFEKAAVAEPQNAEAQRDLATAYYIACTVSQAAEQFTEAATRIRQALAIYEKLAARDPRNAENFSDILSGYGRLADTERRLGHPTEALLAERRMAEYKAKLALLR